MTVFLGIFAADDDDDDDDDDAAAVAAAAIDCGGILSVGEEGRGGLSLWKEVHLKEEDVPGWGESGGECKIFDADILFDFVSLCLFLFGLGLISCLIWVADDDDDNGNADNDDVVTVIVVVVVVVVADDDDDDDDDDVGANLLSRVNRPTS